MDILELKDVCRRVRRNIITMTNKAGAGHPGGSLSATEAMVALYFDVMKGIDPKDDKNPNRDRFVLSIVTISFYIIGNAFADAADPKNHV